MNGRPGRIEQKHISQSNLNRDLDSAIGEPTFLCVVNHRVDSGLVTNHVLGHVQHPEDDQHRHSALGELRKYEHGVLKLRLT